MTEAYRLGMNGVSEMKSANWKVGKAIIMNDGAVAVVSPDTEQHIAFVTCQAKFKRGEGYKAQCAERDANARLIAAAPDLLEALEIADAWIREARSLGSNIPCERTLEMNSAAIAKARGE
jgi:hypothetical protein